MINERDWRQHVNSAFLKAADAIHDKQRGIVWAKKRRRSNNWIDLRIIDNGVERARGVAL